MANLNEEYLKKMAKNIYISPKPEVLKTIELEYQEINQQLNELKKIDITNISPLTRISQPINTLREDIEDQSMILNKEKFLKNANEYNEDFVIIKRIVK